MRRYSLPLLSGVFLALTFYPFYVWPLALIALAPLYYFATDSRHSARHVFWGGALAGTVFSGPLYYQTLAHLIEGLGSSVYTGVIHALFIPATLVSALLCGAVALLWRALYTRSPLANALAGASAWLLLEYSFLLLFQGYFPDTLNAALVVFPGALLLASLGGAQFVSFAAAALGIATLEAARTRRPAALGILGIVVVAGVLVQMLIPPIGAGRALVISTIQESPASLNDLRFGVEYGGVFEDVALKNLFMQAAQNSDIVVYPFAPVLDTSITPAQDAAVGRWLTGFISTSTTVVLWQSVARDGRLFDELDAWQGGQESVYQKHVLYAFSDYMPGWTQVFGVEKTPLDISASTSTSLFMVAGVPAAGLLCSELHQSGYVRAQAAHADVILAAGYDAFFPGALLGNYSLTVARYVAAEAGEPLVRANFWGPSALISADGSVISSLPYGARGVVHGTLPLARRNTLYAQTGPWPLWALITLSLVAALWLRLKSLGSEDQ